MRDRDFFVRQHMKTRAPQSKRAPAKVHNHTKKSFKKLLPLPKPKSWQSKSKVSLRKTKFKVTEPLAEKQADSISPPPPTDVKTLINTIATASMVIKTAIDLSNEVILSLIYSLALGPGEKGGKS